MGCHTWFYKKIEVDHETVKANVADLYKREIDLYDRMISRRDEIDAELLEAYPEWTVEYGIKQKAIYERKLKNINCDLCKAAMYRRYKHGNDLTMYVEGKGFYITNNDLPHDTFRRGNYPDDRLFSLEETLKYLEDNDSIIYYYDNTEREKSKTEAIERLKKFWNEYPDGMIEFG